MAIFSGPSEKNIYNVCSRWQRKTSCLCQYCHLPFRGAHGEDIRVRIVLMSLAYLSLIIAAAGAVLPLLPTTPFVLLAAFFATKGSPGFAQWLENHPRFGPMIAGWRAERAVPTHAKVLACITMIISWSVLALLGMSVVALAVTGLLFAGVASYLVSRPALRPHE